jgi:thiosulfate/3-mercaptopyruvate sulfurtransferase
MRPTQTDHVETPDGPLVGGAWLQASLDTASVRVLDVRGRHPSSQLPHAKRAEYAAAHIPGAVFVDWEHDFVDAEDPVPVQIAGTEAFGRRAGELGVSDEDLVVTYDDYYGIFAARVAWAFRYYGVEARVLDGGWTTWRDEGRPISHEGVEVPPQRFTARPRTRLRRTLAEVQEAQSRGAALVDARPPTCLWVSLGRRTLGTSLARTACPTRSWWTARPDFGPLPTRSPGSLVMPGSAPRARAGS